MSQEEQELVRNPPQRGVHPVYIACVFAAFSAVSFAVAAWEANRATSKYSMSAMTAVAIASSVAFLVCLLMPTAVWLGKNYVTGIRTPESRARYRRQVNSIAVLITMAIVVGETAFSAYWKAVVIGAFGGMCAGGTLRLPPLVARRARFLATLGADVATPGPKTVA